MVIDDFNILRRVISPLETNPILIVNADTVLPFAPGFEGFQPAAWQSGEIA